jgi:hypothetical protein
MRCDAIQYGRVDTLLDTRQLDTESSAQQIQYAVKILTSSGHKGTERKSTVHNIRAEYPPFPAARPHFCRICSQLAEKGKEQ